jgi:hypothetical protein
VELIHNRDGFCCGVRVLWVRWGVWLGQKELVLHLARFFKKIEVQDPTTCWFF